MPAHKVARCGQCRPCLNPSWKKPCLAAPGAAADDGWAAEAAGAHTPPQEQQEQQNGQEQREHQQEQQQEQQQQLAAEHPDSFAARLRRHLYARDDRRVLLFTSNYKWVRLLGGSVGGWAGCVTLRKPAAAVWAAQVQQPAEPLALHRVCAQARRQHLYNLLALLRVAAMTRDWARLAAVASVLMACDVRAGPARCVALQPAAARRTPSPDLLFRATTSTRPPLPPPATDP